MLYDLPIETEPKFWRVCDAWITRFCTCSLELSGTGWTPRLFECAPTYAAGDGDVDAPRREITARIDAFWVKADAYHARLAGLTEEERKSLALPPPVEAISLALQHGVPIESLGHAITRDHSGAAASILGAVIDCVSAKAFPKEGAR